MRNIYIKYNNNNINNDDDDDDVRTSSFKGEPTTFY